jgi:hypothetical protein
VKKLAATLDISESSVTDGMHKTTSVSFKKIDTGEAPKNILTRPEKLETYVLALLLQGKTGEWLEELREHVALEDFVQQAVRTIFINLEKFVRGKRVFLLKDFADSLPTELAPTLDDAYLWDLSDISGDEEKFVREWTVALKELRRSILKRKIREFNRAIQESVRKASDEGEQEIGRLQKEIKECSKVLASLDKLG